MRRSVALAIAAVLAGSAAPAQATDTPLTIGAIEGAEYRGGPLPEGRSALAAKVQVLLDRAGISPGPIDGRAGEMSRGAIRAFEAREGLSPDGRMDMAVWDALGGATAVGLTGRYTIAPSDFNDLVGPLPEDEAARAERDWLGYTRITEKIAEAFHMDEDFLLALNPDLRFGSGVAVAVVAPGARPEGQVIKIDVHGDAGRLVAQDAEGRVVASYPVAIVPGGDLTTDGDVRVTDVDRNPTYPRERRVADAAEGEAPGLPPGPNGPVGAVWIDLAGSDCGIHGLAEPQRLATAPDHGCVGMTNWDVRELAALVEEGASVTFRD